MVVDGVLACAYLMKLLFLQKNTAIGPLGKQAIATASEEDSTTIENDGRDDGSELNPSTEPASNQVGCSLGGTSSLVFNDYDVYFHSMLFYVHFMLFLT